MSWMCSIHIRSRHTLPALLCSRSCCVPQRRCFVFARVFRSAAISAAVFSIVHRVSSMPMEVFCRMTTVRRADLSCVVQAGGLSSRMGCDKARMTFCGEPLIERVLGRLAPVAGELVVTTSRPSELAYLEERTFGGLVPRVVADLEGSAGAMRGIASSLAAARLPLVAIVACDMPFVSPELIGALADHVEAEVLDVCVPREERGIEPLCAVWRRDACAPVAQELLSCDRQRIRCRQPSCSPRRWEMPCLTIFVPTRESLAFAMGPSLVLAAAVAVDILRKRKRPPRRIVRHTAKARPVMPSTTSARLSCRLTALSM